MKVICAWCGKVIQEGEPDKDGKVSHGACKECAEKIMRDIEKRGGKK